ncbi:hypothetical protein J3353_15715, partial [Faecalibacterium sp. Marseille-Q4137]|uniref:hypothetical protein n=1 Tax=Faecalibacterium sp. Marseille-Q4137 TaxID=2817021 RepID=UPI001A9AE7AB
FYGEVSLCLGLKPFLFHQRSWWFFFTKVLSNKKNLRSGSRPKTEILRECGHTPYACSLLVHPEWKERGCGIL